MPRVRTATPARWIDAWPGPSTRCKAVYDAISSTLVAVVSTIRGLSLLLSGRPGTPLRVLCIVAFDTLHVLRHGIRLPAPAVRMLAALLDFGACVNAAFDHKGGRWHGRYAARRLLDGAGLGSSVAEYLRRLGILEDGRPRPGGDWRQFGKLRQYREAVVRLSLGMVATLAGRSRCLDEAIEATDSDGDLNLLFRIVMQCQIIDDVLDYSEDRSAGLPSFLTVCQSLPQALELTQSAARGYGTVRHIKRAADDFPLRAALSLVSVGTRLVVSLYRRRSRANFGPQPKERTVRPGRAESVSMGARVAPFDHQSGDAERRRMVLAFPRALPEQPTYG